MGIRFRTSRNDKVFNDNNIIRNIDIESLSSGALSKMRDVTPVDSGVTKESWSKGIKTSRNRVDIFLENANTTKDGVPIVALLINGHGTKQGYYVPPNDFVSPVLADLEEALDKEIERVLDGI